MCVSEPHFSRAAGGVAGLARGASYALTVRALQANGLLMI